MVDIPQLVFGSLVFFIVVVFSMWYVTNHDVRSHPQPHYKLAR